MPDQHIGAVFTVQGVDGGLAIVLVGPFAAARGVPEYVVAPVYFGTEAGFRQTDEDVRLEAEETGLGRPAFAAIWNARPVLFGDLVLQVGLLPDEAIADTRDAYWASINEHHMRSARLGKPVRSRRDPVVDFQLRELERWEPVSGRVMARARAEVAGWTVPDQLGTTITIDLRPGSVPLARECLEAIIKADRCVTVATLAEDAGVGIGSRASMLALNAGQFSNLVTIIDVGQSPVRDAGAPMGAAANADYALAA